MLGDCGTGSDITRILSICNIEDHSGESTKWRRLYSIFLELQKTYNSPNHILTFIQSFLAPSRYYNRSETFEAILEGLNIVLAFSGIEYGKDGKFYNCKTAETIDEADKRVQVIRTKLKNRVIHPEVLKYCRKELMQDNFFHAVFEASKGLAQRIREMSGADGDGATLIDKVFSVEHPLLAFNSLQCETEKSEHKGFAALLKGSFAAVRNPLAHEPKLLWNGEDDAADYLTLISLLHRKLDNCVYTGINNIY